MKIVLFLIFSILFIFSFYKRAEKSRIKNSLLFSLLLLLGLVGERWVLYGLHPTFFEGTSLIRSALFGFRFDFAAFCLLGGPFLLLLNLPVRSGFYQKIIMMSGMFVIGVCWILISADICYFPYVQRHIGPDIWNFFISWKLVIDLIWKQYKILFIGTVLFVGLLVWIGYKCTNQEKSANRRKPLWEIISLVMLAWLLFLGMDGSYLFNVHFLRPAQGYKESREQGVFTENGVFSVLYALKLTIKPRYVRTHISHPALSAISAEEALKEVQSLYNSNQEFTPQPENPFLRERTIFNADATGRDIVILIFESLDYQHVDSFSGKKLGLTPNIDSLVNQGIRFTNFYACGDASSLFGVGTLLSGVCALSGAPYFGRGLESYPLPGLGKLFAAQGYNTIFVQATYDDCMFIGPLSRLMGFSSYEQKDLPAYSYTKGDIRSDYEALQFLADKMSLSEQPFLGTFFSVSTHEPFSEVYLPADQAKLKGVTSPSYEYSLAYTDWAVGKFIERLKELGKYENTVFVLVGDHRLRSVSAPRWEDNFHIPFAIVAPGLFQAGVDSRVAGQADVLPTLVDIFHISAPYLSMGKSLFENSPAPFTFVSFDSADHCGFINARGAVLESDEVYKAVPTLHPLRKKALSINKIMVSVVKGFNREIIPSGT